MRIRSNKVLWIVPLAVAVLVGFMGWWADRAVRQSIQQKLRVDLTAALNASVSALEIWMHNQKRLAQVVSEEPQVRSLSLNLLNEARQAGTNAQMLAQLPDQAALEEALRKPMVQAGFVSAHLVNSNLSIVSDLSRFRMMLGAQVFEEHESKYRQLFSKGEAEIITPFRPPGFRMFQAPGKAGPPGEPKGMRSGPEAGPRNPPPGKKGGPGPGLGQGPKRLAAGMEGPFQPRRTTSLMQVATPLKGPGARVVGALAFILRPEEEFTRVLSVARWGDSLETYAFDENGLMISQSRFDAQLKQLGLLENREDASSALTLKLSDPGGNLAQGFQPPSAEESRPLITMVSQAVAGKSGVEVIPFRDYRGVPVVGAWRWLPEQQFGVATQMDAAEAYQTSRILRLITVTLILLLALCALGMLMFSYVNVSLRRKFSEAELKAKQLGQYALEEKIGEGGMGVVYKARHALLRRETAIKLLLPGKADALAIRRFEREVRLTCQLTHPNTVQVYDYGHTPEGIFYYAMEFLRGLSLHELVSKFGPQPAERVIHLLAQACNSLREAHAIGLIHRDIKPGNLFLCELGGIPDMVKVLDFGLVRDFGTRKQRTLEVTDSMQLIGTPEYLAPETIRNPATKDPRSDIYALGATGYFLLTGRPVFEGDSFMAVCAKHLSDAPEPPSRIASQPISPELEAVILSCLEKNPDARPATVGDLHVRLNACPEAGNWKEEKRAGWWAQWGPQIRSERSPKERKISSSVAATVRIDLANRYKAEST